MFKAVKFVVVVLFLGYITSVTFGQSTTSTAIGSSIQILPLIDVKEGARGTARTVFSGNNPEEFGVEILGVIPGAIGPHQDLIIGKLSGTNAERTFVFAGMSGSPVYIDGKIIGAISYSFPFSKEPICGITPIEQMISIFEQPFEMGRSNGSPKPISYSELYADIWKPDDRSPSQFGGAVISGMSANSRLSSIAGQTIAPIATPVTFAGISRSTLDIYTQILNNAGMLPVSAVGGTSKILPLKPANATTLLGGDSVVVQLARGDISISAAGTVTLRDNNRIYAFGHPYFGLGSANLPMSESHVVTVVPNANNSFKLTVTDEPVGAMIQDRATGIYGILGQNPSMMPFTINVTTSRGRKETIDLEIAVDDFFTPLIVSIGTLNSIAAYERSIGNTTIEVNGVIEVRGEAPVRFERRYAGPQASAFASSAAALPLSLLLKSNFPGLEIKKVSLKAEITEGSDTAVIERIAVNKSQVSAGETVVVSIFERTSTGELISSDVELVVPADTPAGPISLLVGDGAAIQNVSAVKQFVPTSAADLIRIINSAKRPDLLYVYAFRTTSGAVVGSSEMPNLPPSVLATMNSDRSSGGTTPSVNSLVTEVKVPATKYIVSGSKTITLEVIR